MSGLVSNLFAGDYNKNIPPKMKMKKKMKKMKKKVKKKMKKKKMGKACFGAGSLSPSAEKKKAESVKPLFRSRDRSLVAKGFEKKLPFISEGFGPVTLSALPLKKLLGCFMIYLCNF